MMMVMMMKKRERREEEIYSVILVANLIKFLVDDSSVGFEKLTLNASIHTLSILGNTQKENHDDDSDDDDNGDGNGDDDDHDHDDVADDVADARILVEFTMVIVMIMI